MTGQKSCECLGLMRHHWIYTLNININKFWNGIDFHPECFCAVKQMSMFSVLFDHDLIGLWPVCLGCPVSVVELLDILLWLGQNVFSNLLEDWMSIQRTRKQFSIEMNNKHVLIAVDLLMQREKTFDRNNILYSTFLHYFPSTIFQNIFPNTI